MAIRVLIALLLFLPNVSIAEPTAIGYLQLPLAKKENVQRIGTPIPVVIGGKRGEVWYPEKSHSLALRQFPVYVDSKITPEPLVLIDVSGAWMEIVAESKPGRYSDLTSDQLQKYEDGKNRLLVFEKNDNWVKIQFRDQPPWNGRFGWIQLQSNTGGFVTY